MHIQKRPPGWLAPAARLPDYSLLKSVHDADTLKEAKLSWIVAGRDPKKLVTMYRHFNLEPAPLGSNWAQAVAHWRVNFAKFIDGTWLTQHAPYVDLVEDCNEYVAVSTWVDDDDHGASKLLSMEAAAWVWNNDYRGQGTIPVSCKFTLMCGTVANWWPREVYELSVKYDAPINYHAYAQCLDGARVANDFHDASGLWNNLESHYKIYPEYVFGEVGPYKSSAEGWRSAGCLNGDQSKLVSVARDVQHDTQKTLAYNQNRIIGWANFGAWFTTGGGEEWQFYELQAPQLDALVDMYLEEARLRPPIGDDYMGMDPATKQRIYAHLDEIRKHADAVQKEVESVPLYKARTLIGLRTRFANGTEVPATAPMPSGVLPIGTIIDVFTEPPMVMGGWERRVKITTGGINVWAGDAGTPTFQRL